VLTKVLAGLALLEAAALVAYGAYEAVQGVLVGATGPSEVSNVPAITLQVVIFAVLGVGLAYVARGWWRCRRWARAPFILAQLIGLLIGIPVAQTQGAAPRLAGIAVTVVAAAGVIMALMPQVTRALQAKPDQSAGS